MGRVVTKIEPVVAGLLQRKRVASYARVSLGTAHMLHSLAAQVSYYSELIQKNGEWEYAGVYADADETGTKDNRPEFQRLLADCKAGLIDVVITKSISRFARNTVTLLETVRELKALGIDVFFEEQSIHTLSGDGELMLTILAGYAQEESRSVSENIKWRKRGDMRNGKTKPVKVFGYEYVDGKLIVKPDEAETVRMIFSSFLGGLGQQGIANKLNTLGIATSGGYRWSSSTVRRILINPKMCGDLLHQRTYVDNHITKKQRPNRGELAMYRIEDSHEGIVGRETFARVQTELARRGAIGALADSVGMAFRKKLICGSCGGVFWHTSNGKGASKHRAWMCRGRDKRTQVNCTAQQIPEPSLMKAVVEALDLAAFDGEVFTERIERIIVGENRRLTFVFKDGAEIIVYWKRRKTIPYIAIGFDKRAGRNICYSVIGKGNGKVGERRKQKEAERIARSTGHSGEEI